MGNTVTLFISGTLIVIFTGLLISSIISPNFLHWSAWAALLSGSIGIFGAEYLGRKNK